MSRPSIPLAPFFIGVYPVLAIAAANAEESIDRSDVVICLAVALVVATAGVLVARRLSRRKGAQTLLASLFVLFSLWYGAFVQACAAVLPVSYRSLQAALLPVWILLFLGLSLRLARSTREFRVVPRYLNVVASILLIFSVAQLAHGSAPADPTELGLPMNVKPSRSEVDPSLSRPDIYFIILDKYTGPTSLRKNYGFDPQPFIDSLSAREFYVPRSSRANYVHTHLSIASMLNWTHLDSIAMDVGIDSRDRTKTYGMIEYNRAFRFLENLGYEYVFFPSAYSASWRNRFADRQIPGPFRARISLGQALVAQSPVPAVWSWVCKLLPCSTTHQRFPFTPETPEQIKEKLDSLAKIAGDSGPKFVLMHLLSPHEPYVFRSDCSIRRALWPAADPPADSIVKHAYTEQIQCLNRLLLRSIDGILGNSATSPVIILQSDHGHGRLVLNAVTNEIIPLEGLDDRKLAERTDIFAAYHLPYGGNAVLYDSITPVNVWPAVLNFYFKAGITPREDATYWSDSHSPFRLNRIEAARPR